MAYEVSAHLNCENFFTERDENGRMALRRGFEIIPGTKTLVVEDVVTTGGSVFEVIELVRAAARAGSLRRRWLARNTRRAAAGIGFPAGQGAAAAAA